MRDHKGMMATVSVYQVLGTWRAGWTGWVAVGNGRFVQGLLREVTCAGHAEALAMTRT